MYNDGTEGIIMIIIGAWAILGVLWLAGVLLGMPVSLIDALKLGGLFTGIVWTYRCMGSGRWPWDF